MEGNNTIGTNLFNIRTRKGETQEQVAESIGISYVSLSRYETGQRMPKMNILAKLAEHYGVTVDLLIGNEGKKDPASTGVMRESIRRLFDEISEAGLSDEEADYIRSQVSGVKALRKP